MRAINFLIKPVSGSCNMRCRYCFYEDEMNNRDIRSYGKMSLKTLEILVKKVFAEKYERVGFAFQGGEPTLIGLDFYKKLVEYVNKYNTKGSKVDYSIQTNGLLIDSSWTKFLKEYNFLVGISLDGNKETHDKNRIDMKGEGTFDRVIHTIELLKKEKIDFNVLTVVQGGVADKIGEIYNFYKRNELTYQQYIECLEPFAAENEVTEDSMWLTNQQYASFLIRLFRKWSTDIKNGVYVYNRYFENLLMILLGYQPESCNMLGRCGKQWVVEADGSIFPCDFYVLDQWKLGNIIDDSFEKMDKKREELAFIPLSETIPEECKSCRWFLLCRNGCRRNCEPMQQRVRQKNRFCSAYKSFFENTYTEIEEIARFIQEKKIYFH